MNASSQGCCCTAAGGQETGQQHVVLATSAACARACAQRDVSGARTRRPARAYGRVSSEGASSCPARSKARHAPCAAELAEQQLPQGGGARTQPAQQADATKAFTAAAPPTELQRTHAAGASDAPLCHMHTRLAVQRPVVLVARLGWRVLREHARASDRTTSSQRQRANACPFASSSAASDSATVTASVQILPEATMSVSELPLEARATTSCAAVV
jgi:hypothetical protein